MPVRLWSAFLARDERGLIGARNDRPDKKNERRAAAPGASCCCGSEPHLLARRLTSKVRCRAQRLGSRRAAGRSCIAFRPWLERAASLFALIQILSASTATAARQATSTTSATASYSSQRKLFANITFFRRRVCVKLPEKEARSPYI